MSGDVHVRFCERLEGRFLGATRLLILCCSKTAAENALQMATEILEQDLNLTVNRNKTHIAQSDSGVKFLGVEILTAYTRIQTKKLKALKGKIKQITRRSSWTNLAGVIRQLNPVIRGFANYFRIANCSRELKRLMGWIRRRLRGIQLKQWKKPAKLHRRLKQLGYKPPFKHIKMRSWRNAANPLAHYVMPNSWFNVLKLVNLEEVKRALSPLIVEG
ncbi:hypothetical protein AB833_01675 [Chromatiales bacterium (ex Bugula neritina AB1)]|nr:hypothetical protein AB833_01675 [Chromatiales bacterium (ex Bugula neritina AB1)]